MFKLLKKSKLDGINTAEIKLLNLLILCIFTFVNLYTTPVYAGPDDTVTPDSGVYVDEGEDNDEDPFDISSYFDFENDVLDVLVNGELEDEDDIDTFRFYAPAGSNIDFQLNLKTIKYNDITSFEAGVDLIVFITDSNTIWTVQDGDVSRLLSDSELADDISELELDQIVINDIWITDDSDIIIAFDNVIYIADLDGNLQLLYSASDIETATGISDPQVVNVASSEGYIYIADLTSLKLLQGDMESTGLTVIADYYDIYDAVDHSGLTVIESLDADTGKFSLFEQTIASTTGTFRPTHMIKVSGSEIYSDGFYCTEFSSSIDGNGGITFITPDESDPTAAVFSQFMPADDAIIHPTCLALDTTGSFDNYMYMANFGSNMGNTFDGKVYQIDADGNATDFVSVYLNSDGEAATKGTDYPTYVTGFYDVIDMKFSNNLGSYGDYLYVLSENIDDDTDLGSDSDIWRITPQGVAHLFAENVMSGAGRIVFDTTGNFDGKMIIVPWYGTSDIVTVDADGTVTTLYDGISSNILGAEIAPAGSIFDGSLLLTLDGGDLVGLNYDPNDLLEETDWASDLPLGDIPGGDIVFDGDKDMYLLAGDEDTKAILKYSELLYSFGDTRIQTTLYNRENDLLHQPHISVQLNDEVAIVKVDDLLEEPTTSVVIDSSEFESDDTLSDIGFCFVPNGNCYIYSNNGKWIKVADWDDDDVAFGSFNEISSISHEEIAAETGQEYPEILNLVVSPELDSEPNILFAVTSNGLNNLPDSVLETPTQNIDDDILYMGYIDDEDYYPTLAYGSDRLNMVLVNISGPTDNQSVSVLEYADPNGVFEYELTELEGGDYTITLVGVVNYNGEYEMLIRNKGVLKEYLIDADNPESTLTLSDGQIVKLAIDGNGQALVTANYNPETGNITDIFEIEISGTNSGTVIDILNNDDPHNLEVKYITINNSVKSLTCHGTIEEVRTESSKSKRIKNLSFQDVEQIVLPKCGIDVLQVDSLGFKDDTGVNGVAESQNYVTAKYIKEIDVNEDISNIVFFSGIYTNNYKLIDVDGAVIGTTFYGSSISEMAITNKDQDNNAFYESNCYIKGNIREFLVTRGDISNSNIITQKGYIRELTVSDGNLEDSIITAGNSTIKKFEINASDQNPDNGNVSGDTLISADTNIDSVFIKGNFAKTCEIDANKNMKKIIVSGDCAGRIEAFTLGDLMVGYDIKGKRLQESGDFTGSDFSGDLLSTLNIKEVKITGQMKDDNTGQSNIVSTYGNIKNIFIEDNARGYIYAGKNITTVMVGLIDGKRKQIANEDAEVNLEIDARNLTRLYYTGTRNAEYVLPGDPTIVDLNP